MTGGNFSLTLNKGGGLIMGLTYKENVPDMRESPVGEMVKVALIFSFKQYI